MKLNLFIHAANCISPQRTFLSNGWMKNLLLSENNQLLFIEPDYQPYINSGSIRRMSRLIKTGLAAGMQTWFDADNVPLDGIITGTGRGSMTDTEAFLNDMLRLDETALNPTFFIQSTYNSVSGWLALFTKSNTYNQTFVHRGHSFEWCLLDAFLFAEKKDRPLHILIGSFDEMTPDYFFVKNKIDYWRKEEVSNTQLLNAPKSQGTIAGEGASFFILSNREKTESIVVKSMALRNGFHEEAVQSMMEEVLGDAGLDWQDIDLIISGENGDQDLDAIYSGVWKNLKTKRPVIIPFKHLCGEFDTASGFATWLGREILNTQQIPDTIPLPGGIAPKEIKHVLIVNQYFQLQSSSILLTKL